MQNYMFSARIYFCICKKIYFCKTYSFAYAKLYVLIKGIFSDSNNIFLWYESEDINKKKSFFPKFQLILILRFQVMQDYMYFIAPIDYCVE